MRMMSIDTVIFDLDGVIVDTEHVWGDVRQRFALEHGGHWDPEIDAPKAAGASSMEWAATMRLNNVVHLSVEQIYRGIVDGMKAVYEQNLVVMLGVPESLAALGRVYRLGVASSSPLELIEYALEVAGLKHHFTQLVSSDMVGRGKPWPDVFLETCKRLDSVPGGAVVVEDSTNGLRAAHSAGMAVVAIPNPAFPASEQALGLADLVLGSMVELTPEVVATLGAER
jgi:HAD superfamily hydrolase (TIGR01509 family)